MSVHTIEFNFAEAKRQADKLENTASDVSALGKHLLEDAINQTASCWKGESSRLYLAKARNLQQDILQTAEKLRSASDNIRRTAQRMYEAEMAAIRIAQERTSSGGGGGGAFGGGGGGSRGF